MPPNISEIAPAWLRPTWFIDSDHPDLIAYAERARAGARGERETAVALFLAVRDGIRYDPYATSRDPEAYRASAIARSKANWCVPKSVLLTAAARACGIPARLGFADVRNHLTSEKLSARMGTDTFFWHGYAELLLEGRWLKVSSAFNIEMCDRFGVEVLEFDGTDHALMHPYDRAGNRHMEYVGERGSFDDLPLDEIFATFAEVYPDAAMDDGDAVEAARDDAFA
jgi:transglutaminase-like putative cysteine protease